MPFQQFTQSGCSETCVMNAKQINKKYLKRFQAAREEDENNFQLAISEKRTIFSREPIQVSLMLQPLHLKSH